MAIAQRLKPEIYGAATVATAGLPWGEWITCNHQVANERDEKVAA